MKKIITLIMSIIIISTLAGCSTTGKGSRSWIENEVSDIEKVYPTENLEDLFEKFPNGFSITQTRLFTDKSDRYNIALEIKRDKDTRKIEGKVKKVLIESEPYKETVEKESKVEYIEDKGLILEKSELTAELLPRNYFLFQKLKLNRDILKKLEVKDKSFSFETYRYSIKYLFTNKEIDDYLGLDKGKVGLDIRGHYSERDKTYFHSVVITEDRKELYFGERIVESQEEKNGK